MTHHNLKITDHWWRELYDGRKTCEARLDDRDNHSVAHQDEVIDRRDRSISALRGRITKLRKQLDAKGGVS